MDPKQQTRVPSPQPEQFKPQPTPIQPLQPQQPLQSPLPPQDPHFPANHPTPDNSKPVTNDPGKVLGIISFVGVFFGLGLVSIILGIIGLKKSKQAGHSNGFALAGIILGILEVIAGIIVAIVLGIFIFSMVDTCNELGTGTHTLLNGSTITCNL
jgi:hypothetical protein